MAQASWMEFYEEELLPLWKSVHMIVQMRVAILVVIFVSMPNSFFCFCVFCDTLHVFFSLDFEDNRTYRLKDFLLATAGHCAILEMYRHVHLSVYHAIFDTPLQRERFWRVARCHAQVV